VSPEKIATVTYGAQRPKYAGHDDTAHAKNRRDDLLVH
jgi:outer membrane protein OmpA-like peptidoglycan-associated protein